MQEYDVTLKLLLQQSRAIMQALTGTTIKNWLDIELPRVQNPRVDLLGEATNGDLIHLELQSTNDPQMALRMAEYWLAIFRRIGRFPPQILLYVGAAPLNMGCELSGPGGAFQYTAVDIRDLDGEQLLESPDIGDNVIAILARLGDQRRSVRDIVARIAALGPQKRRPALDQLLILAGLRQLTDAIEQEVRTVPIEIDYLENPVVARYYQRGQEKGRQEGREAGREAGRQEGELILLRRLLEKRFGPLPAWADGKLASRTLSELEELSLRLLDAATLEDLLK